MSIRGIYQKACPSCAAMVAIEARQCRCGYSFDEPAEHAESLAEDQALQEEELMKEYLNARIEQAVAELQAMQGALAADPKNMDKAGKLMKAYVALHDLRAELGSQSAKTEAAKDAALDARRERGWETDEPTAITSQPNETFRAEQARKAEQIMQAAGMGTKTCPKCRAVVPERAVLCFCGFGFERGDDATPRSTAAPDIDSHKSL